MPGRRRKRTTIRGPLGFDEAMKAAVTAKPPKPARRKRRAAKDRGKQNADYLSVALHP